MDGGRVRRAAGLDPPGRRSSAWRLLLHVFLVGCCLMLLAIALFAVVVGTDVEARRFVLGVSIRTDAAACDVPLRRIEACRHEDRSWIECRVAYRAEGEPDRDLCARFLESRGATPARGPCSYERPAGWSPVACDEYGLDLDRCFRCAFGGLEARHELLQAFDATCSRSVVARVCNDDLRRAAIDLRPAPPSSGRRP